MDIQKIRSMAKTLSVVKENNMGYFLVKSDIQSKHIILMSKKQQMLLNYNYLAFDKVILMSRVIKNNWNNFLIFD
jgi:hypothetical protein